MKKHLKLLALLLVLVQCFLLLPTTLFASGEVTLTYTYANEICADGEGTLVASGLTAGSYTLYFVNEDGALPGYEAIAEKTVSTTEASFAFPRAFLLPPAADGIALYKGEEQVAVYEIPAEKKISSAVEFTFASVSDVHMNLDDPSTNYGASLKWTAALNFFDSMGMEAVVVSGDLTGSGTSTEYERYKAAIEASTYDASDIYEGLGNHDATQVPRFLTYTKGVDDVHPSEGSAWFYVMKEGKNGARDNLFIFMAQELTNTSGTHTGDNFSDEQMDWVEGLLETYAGTETNIFLIVHPMIKNFGPGDRVDGAYSQPLYFNDNYPGNMRFKELLTTYKEVIKMSGHTHLSLREGLNFSDEDGTAARMIHNASISQPRGYTSTGSISYDNGGKTTATKGSEGYLVYVYDECVTYVGYDLTEKKAIPTASYLIPLYSEDRDAAVSIEITKQPTKTTYEDGEWFDGAGMVVTATYANGTTAEVKGWSCSKVGALSNADTEISISYGSCAPVSVSITVGDPPSKNGEGVLKGSGTVADPFLISTPADFAFLTDLFNASNVEEEPGCSGYFYLQTADIDMTGYEGYDGTHLDKKCFFGGIYDGGGHTITVDINYEGSDGQASVFPYVTGAIMNLKIAGSITSSYSAQPIRTIMAGAVVANCIFDMTLSAQLGHACCYSMYGTAYNVFMNGTASYGIHSTRTGTYYNCFTYVFKPSGSKATTSQATHSNDYELIAETFNDREGSAALSGLAALKTCNPALGEKALGTVSVEDGTLVLSGGEITVPEVIVPVIPGSGTESDPYIIATPEAFKMLTDYFNASTSESGAYGTGKYYLQTADIDMTDCIGYDGTHILNSTRKCYFGGIYNGNGHTITVNIEYEGSDGQTAVFPYITGAILNLKITGSINSPESAQPIRTIRPGAVVANCIFDMELTGKYANGLCYSNYGKIYNSFVCGIAVNAAHRTNEGSYYNCYTNMKNVDGEELTTSKATSTENLSVVVSGLADRTSSTALQGIAAMTAVNESLTAEDLLTISLYQGELIFGEVEEDVSFDVNKDGAVDISDVTAILKSLAGSDDEGLVDLNDDGAVDISDVTTLLSYLANGSSEE